MVTVIVKEMVEPGRFVASGMAISEPEGETRHVEIHIEEDGEGNWTPCLPGEISGREIIELQFIREKSEQATAIAVDDTLSFRANFILKSKK